MTESEERKPIPLILALIPIAYLIIALSVNFIVLQFDRPEIAIVSAAVVASAVAVFYGYRWKDIERGMINGINLAMNAILILITIGMMIGTWMLGGVVPTMIYYGLQILNPGIFLLASMIICSIVSLGTGSSWSTAGTVGVALVAIGHGLGIPLPMVAGAVVSGAYFGDKMSPLSDTTNLAPAVAGTDVITHVKHMVWTVTPSYLIAGVLFFILGLQFSGDHLESGQLDAMLAALSGNFNVDPLLLIAPVLVIAMVVMKIPPIPAILAGAFIGGVFAMTHQAKPLVDVLTAAYDFTRVFTPTGLKMVDDLVSRGGMTTMLPTVGLIMCALSFGGIMERTGMLGTIAAALLERAKSSGSLIATTIFSCISINILAADQYMSIVIPGRMYKNAYDKRGLHPKNLSRALEDSGTLTSPLIPWNSCGAFMFATLGVHPFLYLPFAFLNLINPFISLIYGFTGFTIVKAETKGVEERPVVEEQA